jgi:hypothetical protein
MWHKRHSFSIQEEECPKNACRVKNIITGYENRSLIIYQTALTSINELDNYQRDSGNANSPK